MKIKLPKGGRTLSGERRGGQMWDELKKWIQTFPSTHWMVLDKMNEIEKQHGIDYV